MEKPELCGIAGYSGIDDPNLLAKMSLAMSHRGPDGAGVWSSTTDHVGLAHRRLAIIDLDPRGMQPMWDAGLNLAIAFNGEIFNHRELRRQLLADGYTFRTETDTEVILNLFLQRDKVALEALEGMFAFALWDNRRKTMTLARDAHGVKPLYLASTKSGVIFASEIKSLLQSREVKRDIDPVAIVHHLTCLWSPGPRTVLANVHKLEPGTWTDLVGGHAVKSGSFRGLSASRSGVPSSPTAIRAALVESVNRQLVSDVPVGAFLSGGVDSTAVVSIARREIPELACFTVAGESKSSTAEGFSDDIWYARRAAKALGVRLYVAKATSSMSDHIDFMLYHLDEPTADLAPLHVYSISTMASSIGVKVLLSGAGGDDLFGGYRRHLAARLERYWDWSPEMVRRILGRSAQRLPGTSPGLRRVRRALANAGMGSESRTLEYLHWIDPKSAVNLLTPEFRAQVATPELDGELRQVLSDLPVSSSNLARLLALDERFFLVDHNLNYTDKMSMAAGVEVRVPFMDRMLVKIANSLADRQLVRGLTPKVSLRQAVRGLVPDEVIDRPKAGFGVPLREWIAGPLSGWLHDQLSPATLEHRGFFDVAAVQSLLRDNEARRVDGSYTLLAMALIERWMQIFVDSTPRPMRLVSPGTLEWEVFP